MIALEPDERNRVLLAVLYAASLRVSEACGLRWRNLQARGEAGQILIHGKGGRARVVLLPAGVSGPACLTQGHSGRGHASVCVTLGEASGAVARVLDRPGGQLAGMVSISAMVRIRRPWPTERSTSTCFTYSDQ
jgi:hypothetical protein